MRWEAKLKIKELLPLNLYPFNLILQNMKLQAYFQWFLSFYRKMGQSLVHGRMDDLQLYVLFCRRHYKVKFDIDPG